MYRRAVSLQSAPVGHFDRAERACPRLAVGRPALALVEAARAEIRLDDPEDGLVRSPCADPVESGQHQVAGDARPPRGRDDVEVAQLDVEGDAVPTIAPSRSATQAHAFPGGSASV